jgi:hypothetical protein
LRQEVEAMRVGCEFSARKVARCAARVLFPEPPLREAKTKTFIHNPEFEITRRKFRNDPIPKAFQPPLEVRIRL